VNKFELNTVYSNLKNNFFVQIVPNSELLIETQISGG